MIFDHTPLEPDNLRMGVRRHYRIDEPTRVDSLLAELQLPRAQNQRIEDHARELVAAVRNHRTGQGDIDALGEGLSGTGPTAGARAISLALPPSALSRWTPSPRAATLD